MNESLTLALQAETVSVLVLKGNSVVFRREPVKECNHCVQRLKVGGSPLQSQQQPGLSEWILPLPVGLIMRNEIGTGSPKVKGMLQKGSETLESNFPPYFYT